MHLSVKFMVVFMVVRMPKKAAELNFVQIKTLKQPGRHAVGGTPPGLSISVSDTGAKSWIFRASFRSKRRHIGLGSFPEVSLADARKRALEIKRTIAAGIDPIQERRDERYALIAAANQGITFKAAFDQYFEEKVRPELKNEKHVKQWCSTISTYAFPVIGEKGIGSISVEDVNKILSPIWNTKNETASRVRQRIEAVLDWSKAKGLREGENPALWKGNLQLLLPSPNKVQRVENFPAIALEEIAAWFRILRNRTGMAARALEFLTLTASRSGEIRKAVWSEIDLPNAIWTIPAHRMKAGREHRVPLSSTALSLLSQLPRMMDCPFIFPSPKNQAMSDMTISAVMRRIQAAEEKEDRVGFLDSRSRRPAVPHGLRSSFRDWAAEVTDYPRDMAEIALAHTVGDAVERAYRRGDMVTKRRQMMEDWAKFLG